MSNQRQSGQHRPSEGHGALVHERHHGAIRDRVGDVYVSISPPNMTTVFLSFFITGVPVNPM
jgi:hypothetical protein